MTRYFYKEVFFLSIESIGGASSYSYICLVDMNKNIKLRLQLEFAFSCFLSKGFQFSSDLHREKIIGHNYFVNAMITTIKSKLFP